MMYTGYRPIISQTPSREDEIDMAVRDLVEKVRNLEHKVKELEDELISQR